MIRLDMERFTVRQVSPFESDEIPKTLGEYETWDDAITLIFDAIDRKNMVITEFCTDPKCFHTFRFNEEGMVVYVDHFCNEKCCKYNDLESLNK